MMKRERRKEGDGKDEEDWKKIEEGKVKEGKEEEGKSMRKGKRRSRDRRICGNEFVGK